MVESKEVDSDLIQRMQYNYLTSCLVTIDDQKEKERHENKSAICKFLD